MPFKIIFLLINFTLYFKKPVVKFNLYLNKQSNKPHEIIQKIKETQFEKINPLGMVESNDNNLRFLVMLNLKKMEQVYKWD